MNFKENSLNPIIKIGMLSNAYNKLKGIANYKRTSQYEDVKEYIWIVEVKV